MLHFRDQQRIKLGKDLCEDPEAAVAVRESAAELSDLGLKYGRKNYKI